MYFLLRNIDSQLGTRHLDAQEVFEVTKICDSKTRMKELLKISDKNDIISGDHYVINIYQQCRE